MRFDSNNRYYSLNSYLKEKFNEKVYKLSLDGGMTCPNRDGTLGSRGCIFCSEGGSGEFAADRKLSVNEQIAAAKLRIKDKAKCNKYIAYFQNFTNTYAPYDYLEKIFTQAIESEEIVALSIATRPDCLQSSVLNLLERLNRIKPVWVELGLQTMHENTAKFIRRGYDLACFEKAVENLKAINIEVIVHLILGLPFESREDILESVYYVSKLKVNGVKLQLLHILKGTDLEKYYNDGKIHVLSLKEYTDILIDCIRILSKDIVIHRITGDGPKSILIAPKWSGDKKRVLNYINSELKKRDIFQGMGLYD